jgi:lambda family phage portal protein
VGAADKPKPTSAIAARPFTIGFFDRFLLGVAPSWGLNRLRSRAAAFTMQRHYEAAKTGRRTAGWSRSASDGTAALAPDIVALRELSRDLRRNNGWARRGVQTIVNNTVGWGLTAKPRATAPGLEERAAAIWNGWASSIACDFDGRLPFTGLQALALETIVESGEVLILKEAANTADGLSVPIRIRVIEPDYLDSNLTVPTGQPSLNGRAQGPIRNGIEFDGNGRRIAYWIFDRHPGSMFYEPSLQGLSRRVPASEVLHVYRVDRPGTLRGAPWLASAIARLNDFDDYEDAILMQQKIAACFGAFVTDYEGASTALGEQSTTDERLESLEPGHIAYLPPGKTVSFATPPNVSNQEVFSASNLRRIAASLGVTYEDMTGDYSKVNFSSARMGRIAHWANVYDWRWNMLVPQFCDRVWAWVMGEAQKLNGWPELPAVAWSAPPAPMLEPDKEGLSNQRLIRSGTKTLYEIIRENGGDPEAHLQEIAAINARLDALGIVLDSDPRKTSGAGQTQANTEESAAPDGGKNADGLDEIGRIERQLDKMGIPRP